MSVFIYRSEFRSEGRCLITGHKKHEKNRNVVFGHNAVIHVCFHDSSNFRAPRGLWRGDGTVYMYCHHTQPYSNERKTLLIAVSFFLYSAKLSVYFCQIIYLP